jgi:hypothetical protein
MKKRAHVKVILPLALVVVVMFPSSGNAQEQRQSVNGDSRQSSNRQEEWLARSAAISGIHNNEEKLVRGAYAKLMRYQHAYVAETAEVNKLAARPQDNIEFELRNFHTGPIEEISDELYEDIVSPPTGDILTVAPSYRNQPNDPKFAVYIAHWTKRNTSSADRSGMTIGEMLGLASDRPTDVDFFASYEVTVRLAGKEQAYQAMALYRKAAQQDGKRRIEILDNITANMNVVLEDNSPVVRTPWKRYVTSGSYFATERTIKEARGRGVSPIGEDMAIGSLPGDDATPNEQDLQKSKVATAALCLAPGTTADVVVIAWVNPNAIDLPDGANSALRGALNSPLCSGLVLQWVAQAPDLLYSDADRAYANAFLVKYSGNAEPPASINPDTILAGGNFRLFNRFKVQFSVSNGVITNPWYLQSVSSVGSTPDPCGLLPSLPGDAHPSNGAGVTASGTSAYQLTEGRVGLGGRLVNLTINGRTTPWIWSVIRFNASGFLDATDAALFPTYYVYRNGQRIQTLSQTTLSIFIQKDETYQRLPWEIR